MQTEKSNTVVYVVILVILLAPLVVFINNYQKAPDEQAQLKKFSSLTELKDFLKGSQKEYGVLSGTAATRMSVGTAAEQAGAPVAAKVGADDYSATNIQVTGVDESDIVKNDGKYIYTISGNNVVIADAYPPENSRMVSAINLGGGNPQNIYVNGDRLVVFGNVYDYSIRPLEKPSAEPMESPAVIRPSFPTTYIRVYDISDRASPVLKKDLVLNGTYFNSRMIGDYVYAIVNAPTYYLKDDIVLPFSDKSFSEIYYFDVPDYSYQFTNILSLNVKDGKEAESKVFLLGSSNALFVSKDNIYMVYQKRLKPSYAMDRLIDDVILPFVPAGVAEKLKEIRDSNMSYYEKEHAIEEVAGGWLESLNPEEAARITKSAEEKYAEVQRSIAKEIDKSVIHKISISDGRIEYKTHGEVPGQPLNQFSMDEYNGYFRIATTTSPSGFGGPVPIEVAAADAPAGSRIVQTSAAEIEKPAAPMAAVEPSASSPPLQPPPQRSRSLIMNNIYVLDSDMKIVGMVEDLAPGERIFSARFMGDRAYLVTFVRIDPLFVIDLRDPANPRVVGELKIPGVSDYLHPYDENHIIGVGRSTEDPEGRGLFKGLKISLFDVSDVNNPKEVAKYEIGERGTDSEALHDHKAFLFSKEKNLLVIPVLLAEKPYEYSWQGAYVFGITSQNLSLKGKITHDVAQTQKEFYYQRYPVRRSLYIGNALYTISDAMVKASGMDDLKEIKSINLLAVSS